VTFEFTIPAPSWLTATSRQRRCESASTDVVNGGDSLETPAQIRRSRHEVDRRGERLGVEIVRDHHATAAVPNAFPSGKRTASSRGEFHEHDVVALTPSPTGGGATSDSHTKSRRRASDHVVSPLSL